MLGAADGADYRLHPDVPKFVFIINFLPLHEELIGCEGRTQSCIKAIGNEDECTKV